MTFSAVIGSTSSTQQLLVRENDRSSLRQCVSALDCVMCCSTIVLVNMYWRPRGCFVTSSLFRRRPRLAYCFLFFGKYSTQSPREIFKWYTICKQPAFWVGDFCEKKACFQHLRTYLVHSLSWRICFCLFSVRSFNLFVTFLLVTTD